LNVIAIVDAVKKTGADAVHPGYGGLKGMLSVLPACRDASLQRGAGPSAGFLSENAAFVKAVEEAGATFIGPPVFAVEKMGDKVESKKFAAAAAVNTIPGWAGVTDNVDHAVAVACEIGFPVMVKASAGGGGKVSCWQGCASRAVMM
jgi:propionyl-CoA carboxylase alpha chain